MKTHDMTKARIELENLVSSSLKLILTDVLNALDPQPEVFDWAKVRPGMAFQHITGSIHWYCGPDPRTKDMFPIFVDKHGVLEHGDGGRIALPNLKRLPEHDKVLP